MASRVTRNLFPRGLLTLVLCAATLQAAPSRLETEAAEAARLGKWNEVLEALTKLAETDPARYADGRFEYLTARSLAETGRSAEALARFERFAGTDDLFDVPARLAAAQLRFAAGDGARALDLLLPLLQRPGAAVSRRAVRIALDALEIRLDVAALRRLTAARPNLPPREKRRLLALEAEALESEGASEAAASLRRQILSEARRDDAAAIVLARELRGRTPKDLPDGLLSLLIETARAQRDLELAERLAVEKERRSVGGDPASLWSARFDLGRIKASRGKWAEAEQTFRALLATAPASPYPARAPRDDRPGTAAFFGRVRFNLAAVLEKQGRLDEAAVELGKVAAGRAGPSALSVVQAARLEIGRSQLDRAEQLLSLPAAGNEPGRIEALLLLVARRCERGEPSAAGRVLARVASARRLPEPWKSEIPFWRARVAEAGRDFRTSLAVYLEILGSQPYTIVGDLARTRLLALPAALREEALRKARKDGAAFLAAGDAERARRVLSPAALLGDPEARDFLRLAYQKLPRYEIVALAPELTFDTLPSLCGDAAACRLLQLGLPREAEPIVRDARRLDSLVGCLLAARLAEDADAGPAALEAAEALERKVPRDFVLELAPASIRRGLAPRPFDRLVKQAAAESDVPPGLLYAVMRQESRFDHQAASPAAARGLMQLTLPAAGEAARELNEEPPAYMDLYDPLVSIRLGARTLRSLLDRFQNDAPSAVAAYNAGGGQTTLWRAGSGLPGEALLAAISYGETRVYFRRVLANRLVYRLAER
ncbi:MAG: transglycosylase SLT domain-containing protein [Acidobacteria bacterium]|nr:transglycosylase SLT domain-containing protein [Acidobacteriota bacterium]